MPSVQPFLTNAKRRSLMLETLDDRLKEFFPDDGDAPAKKVRGFDDVELYATLIGDATTCRIMEELLHYGLTLPVQDRPERCDECGRKLQYSMRKKTIMGIRGPVTFEREYAYCRKCRSGFFPC